jgi:hypothetical protein
VGGGVIQPGDGEGPVMRWHWGEGLRAKREREREVWDAASGWMELGSPGEEREVTGKEESS